MSEATKIASMGITTMIELMQAKDEIKRLKEALAKQEQGEPVAWQWLTTAHFRKKLPKDAEKGAWNPLYTTPQQRKPLSSYINSAKINATDLPHIVVEKLEKAIEAAHGIKEKNT